MNCGGETSGKLWRSSCHGRKGIALRLVIGETPLGCFAKTTIQHIHTEDASYAVA